MPSPRAPPAMSMSSMLCLGRRRLLAQQSPQRQKELRKASLEMAGLETAALVLGGDVLLLKSHPHPVALVKDPPGSYFPKRGPTLALPAGSNGPARLRRRRAGSRIQPRPAPWPPGSGCHRTPLDVGTPRRVSSSAAARTLSVATCPKTLASALARSSAARALTSLYSRCPPMTTPLGGLQQPWCVRRSEDRGAGHRTSATRRSPQARLIRSPRSAKDERTKRLLVTMMTAENATSPTTNQRARCVRC
jgi:hypothetical protein